MESLFTWCAVIGGTIFAVQFVMLLIGLDGSGDLDFDAPDIEVPDMDIPELEAPEIEATGEAPVSMRDVEVDYDQAPDAFAYSDGWFVGIVTFRSLVAALAVFGFTGLGAIQQFEPAKAFTIAALAGFGVLYLVGWLFKQLYKLRSDGTVHMRDAVGTIGTVYLTIPAEKAGAGKVTVTVAERTMEYLAMTPGEMLKTGTPIKVTNIISEDTLEVTAV